MSKFLKISGSLGCLGLSAILFKEKQRYDALPDKSTFVLFDDIVNKDKLVQLYDDSLIFLRSKQDGYLKQQPQKPEEISPEHVEIAIIPLEYDEKSDAITPVEAAAVNDDVVEEKSDAITPVEAAAVNDDVVEEKSDAITPVEAVELEPLKIQDHVPITNSESDCTDVLDVKVAFSDESIEKVLDPKLDFARLQTENEAHNSTLSRLGRSSMELGIALGDLMADVPEIQPRLNQVYKELQELFQNVSNLEKEQENLVSKALQEQGSEFSEVLEKQWEVSMGSIAAQAQELEQEYSQKLNDFKVAFANQMQQEETEKFDSLRREYEADKASALSTLEQELVQKWEAIVEEKLDQERDGRLAKLDNLGVKVQILQNLTQDIAFKLEQKYNLQKIEIALENLSAVIVKSPGAIEAEFNNLWLVGAKYPFIHNILSSLPKDIAVSGVTEYNDLIRSFLQLRKSISGIKYMPENGGAFSYLISSFGPRSRIGEITCEVLENSSDCIANGDIDSAARQLNRLRGWQRVLSIDWLADARRYLELKQALAVIHDYVRLEKLEVI